MPPPSATQPFGPHPRSGTLGRGRSGPLAVVVALIAFAGAGCELAREVIGGDSRRDALRETVVSERVRPGTRFLGELGDGPIRSVEAAGEDAWRIAVPDRSAPGGETIWELTLDRIEVFPLHGGEDFADWLQETATEADRRAGLTQAGWRMVADDRILALGRVQGRAVEPTGSGRVEVDVTAFLRTGETGADPAWELVEETRTASRLRRAVETAYEKLMYRDDRVMDCAETADPRSAPRSELLDCAARVLDEEFGREEALQESEDAP